MANEIRRAAITGSYGYSGRFITERLLAKGYTVRTLTNRKIDPNNDPFKGRIEIFPLDFDPNNLEQALSDCDILINTYWVRFNHKNFCHETAVENTHRLFQAAISAGIRRIVHVSIANPKLDSPFEYYRGKARIEEDLRTSGIPYSILRPAVLFGAHDILINNIAWTLRHFPIIGYFGDGNYRIRPIYVEDFADLAIQNTTEQGNRIIDAVGPEDYTYKDLLATVSKAIGKRRLLLPVPIFFGRLVAEAIGRWHNDIFLTREEIGALMANVLTSNAPSSGETKLSEWLSANSSTVGKSYACELARR